MYIIKFLSIIYDKIIFFLELCSELEKENSISRLPKSLKDELLAKPLICNQCEFMAKNLPTLKEHLSEHLQDFTGKRTKNTN